MLELIIKSSLRQLGVYISLKSLVNECTLIYVRLPVKSRIQLREVDKSTDLELKGAFRITLAALF